MKNILGSFIFFVCLHVTLSGLCLNVFGIFIFLFSYHSTLGFLPSGNLAGIPSAVSVTFVGQVWFLSCSCLCLFPFPLSFFFFLIIIFPIIENVLDQIALEVQILSFHIYYILPCLSRN